MDVDLDALARRAREQAAPDWNDVREQRVLTAVQRGAPRDARRAPLGWIAVGTLALAASLLLGLLAWPDDGPAVAGSRLELEDGSVCRLDDGARVRVAHQTAERVQLQQERGRVVYDVSHRPERSFEVVAPPITVRVRGTRFAVEVSDEAVRVVVEEGRVAVEARGQTTELMAGDALRVARPSETASVPATREPMPGSMSEPTRAPGLEPDPLSPTEEAGEPDPPPAEASGSRPRRSSEAPANPGAAPPSIERSPSPAALPAALLAEADAHRRAGRAVEAGAALERLLAEHPSDARVPSAAFTLGRVRRRLGQPGAAAQAFERARTAAPAGPLAEDALAEEASSWADAGDRARAARAAERYLHHYPGGLHATRMRALTNP